MALPEEFIARINSYGSPVFDGLIPALQGEPVVSVRYNPRKLPSPHPEAALTPVPWCGAGRYLSERPAFTFDPALHQGRYYVQDASSMFISHVISHLTRASAAPLRVLDACAAPGGKTTAAIDALPPGSLMVANEYVPLRAAILRENLTKWGYPGCIVTRGDTSRFRKLPDRFDIVIADVPCSGEGMMRKDPVAAGQWTPALVEQCAARQREIVDNLWTALRPGGYFVYSTCTFNRDENEMMAHYITSRLGGEPVTVPVDDSWHIAPGVGTSLPCYRFIPGRIAGEGLFMFVARKPGTPSAVNDKPARRARDRAAGQQPAPPLPAWLRSVPDMTPTVSADSLFLFPAAWQPELEQLSRHLDVIYYGVEAGRLKGRDIIPSQALAMSPILPPDAFPSAEVDRPTALQYLHGQAIALPDGTPRGHVMLTYQQLPLGFVKNLGNRANNLYPDRWRIISDVTGR